MHDAPREKPGGGAPRETRGAYPLVPRPKPPALPGEVVVRDSMESLIDAIAADLVIHAKNCVRAFGDFHLALSGAERLTPLYMRLMYDPDFRDLPWKRTHLWIVDEAIVPPDDRRSRYRIIRETIVDHSDIPRAQTHPAPALHADPARAYERELQESLAWREKGHDRLDYVLLDVGAGGGVESLAHANDTGESSDRLVRQRSGGPGAPERVSMTPRLLNASRLIALVAAGDDRRDALHAVADADPGASPSLRSLRPVGGTLRWYLDHDACGSHDD